MELAKMIQYQKIDMDLYRLEKEYSQSKEIERVYRCKKMFDEKKEALVKLAKELDDSFAQIAKFDEKITASTAADDIAKIAPETATDETALSDLDKEFSVLEEEITSLSRDVNRILKKINEIGFDNKRINDEMAAINNDYKATNAALEKKKADMLEKAKPIAAKLKALLPELDEGAFNKYKELRKAKKMPAFVVYHEGNCGGCGMDISIEVGKKLVKGGDLAECPHCGRVVYRLQ